MQKKRLNKQNKHFPSTSILCVSGLLLQHAWDELLKFKLSIRFKGLWMWGSFWYHTCWSKFFRNCWSSGISPQNHFKGFKEKKEKIAKEQLLSGWKCLADSRGVFSYETCIIRKSKWVYFWKSQTVLRLTSWYLLTACLPLLCIKLG